MRQRGGSTRQRDHQEAAASAEIIGRQLRSAREQRGLDLLTVHDRLNRSITQLEALESGDLAPLADQAQALSTLRRYAVFLGLDGDALALKMIDAWSAAPTPAVGSTNTAGATAVIDRLPEHLRAFTETGQVPRVGRRAARGAPEPKRSGIGGPPTGTFPVVPRQDLKDTKRELASARRRLQAPTSLKIITWLTLLLLIAVLAGLGIYRWRPQWLITAHILRVEAPFASPGTQATPTFKTAPAVTLTSTANQSASYNVNAKAYTVGIAVTGQCWLQVTSSTALAPLVVGVQPAGKRLSFPASGTMTVQVGASAVTVGISINGKNVFYNAPQAVPFTYTFTTNPTS